MRTDLIGSEFDSVLDVGGNVGDFAEEARQTWRDALVTSFEPVPRLANLQEQRAAGRWWVECVAISDREGTAVIHYCENQHSASTMQEPGGARGLHFGLKDRYTDVTVRTAPLDKYLDRVQGRCLVKIDVEGHERAVLSGGMEVLRKASVVIIEVQNDPTIFVDSAPCCWISDVLYLCGLSFYGVADAFIAPGGRVLQFDAVWRRSD